MKCSIICNTFNHERFIKQALDGFLSQIVDFDYEILIHDDASTDNTRKIVEEYRFIYPDIIKPIYQTENQTQKGLSVSEINVKRANGEYIAICEGDDYWIDRNKLQKQINFLDDNEAYNCVGHACIVKNVNFPNKTKYWSFKKVDCKIELEEIIKNRGLVFAYNTVVFRNDSKSYPDFFKDFRVADVKRVIFSGLNGNVYYFEQAMSIYQVGIRGSWTERVRFNNKRIINHYNDEIKFYQNLNAYTLMKYDQYINLVINQLNYYIKLHRRDKEIFNTKEYSDLKYHKKAQIVLIIYFPNFYNFIRKLKFHYWI